MAAVQNIEEVLHRQNWEGWAKYIGSRFIMGPVFTIETAVNDFKADGVMNDGTQCCVLRIPSELHDLVSQLFFKKNPYLLQIYYLSMPYENMFLTVTERYYENMNLKEWMDTHPVMEDHEIVDIQNFLYPVRFLLNNIIGLLEIYDDFKLISTCVYLMSEPNRIQFKIGIIFPEERKGRKLCCLRDFAKMYGDWLDKSETFQVPNDIVFLRHVIERIDPHDFCLGKMKESLFYFVIKLDLMLGHSSWHQDMKSLMLEALHKLGHQNLTESSKWFNRGMANPAIGMCWDEAPHVQNEVRCMILEIRNIAAHIAKYMTDEKITLEHCYDNLEEMLPGCWAAMHFVAMKSELITESFILDDDFL